MTVAPGRSSACRANRLHKPGARPLGGARLGNEAGFFLSSLPHHPKFDAFLLNPQIVRKTCEISNSSSARSEEHTSELQSLMRISYAVFCLKKKNHTTSNTHANNSCNL